jgi:uroporphyrinogen decarboxylase
MGEQARRLYENTEHCLVADIPCIGPFEGGCTLRGYEHFLLDLYQNRKFAEALLERITETALRKWDLLLAEVGPYVQVAAQGDDIGMQQSTYISPEMYRRFIKPLHKKIFDLIHSRTRAKVFLHSCGSVYAILPDLLEIGLDVLNPVQSSAAHMDLGRLKSEFGRDLCFWGGGIDIQQQLPFLDPREIKLEIQKTLRIMAPGGGYVFAFTHNVQPDVPPEKVDGALRAFLELRQGR